MTESELKKLENKLWSAADKMRGAVSVSNYKFIVLGLIFLKYISDSFEDKYKELLEEGEGLEEERDCYIAENIFYVPKKARWEYLVEHSKDTNIGEIIDDALTAIEKENTSLKNVLPKDYNSPTMRNVNLGELIDLFTNIKVGTKEAKEKDLLGRIYEYFLGQFAKNELQKGGEFYTPACLVRTMVECIEPFQGKVYDPACGSGGMFVQSMKFVNDHQGNPYNIGIFGQEKNPTTWRLAKMNLAIRSMYGELGKYAADTFTEDLHKDLKADFILANPPFNLEWDRDNVEDDPRWKYGLPPKNNANYAWLQHMISKLSQNGKAAIILANGALSATGEEGKIRENLIKSDLIECIISMPEKLFYTVSIPCSIWIINRNKKRKNEILFVVADNLGHMVSKKLRELDKNDIAKISNVYHEFKKGKKIDMINFAKSCYIEEIEQNKYILTPGRYVKKEKIERKIDLQKSIDSLNENIKNSLITEIMVDIYYKAFCKNIEDFEIVKLGDLVTKASTGADAIQKAPIVDENTGIKCIRIGDITNNRPYDEWGYCKIDTVNYEKYKLSKGDIIVGRTSAIGINRYIYEDKKAVYNNGLIRLTVDSKKVLSKYLYIILNTFSFYEYIDRIKKETSTRENMKLDYLLNFKFRLPSLDIQEHFVMIYQEIEKYIGGLINYNKVEKIINELI